MTYSDLGTYALLALCVAVPSTIVLLALRYLYERRFARNFHHHLSCQQLGGDYTSPIPTIMVDRRNAYGANIVTHFVSGTVGWGGGCGAKTGSPRDAIDYWQSQVKVREYVASIPPPGSLTAIQIDELEDEMFRHLPAASATTPRGIAAPGGRKDLD